MSSDAVGQNRFTKSIAMLLYEVVQNARLYQNNDGSLSSNLKQILFVNCREILKTTKNPTVKIDQSVVSFVIVPIVSILCITGFGIYILFTFEFTYYSKYQCESPRRR